MPTGSTGIAFRPRVIDEDHRLAVLSLWPVCRHGVIGSCGIVRKDNSALGS